MNSNSDCLSSLATADHGIDWFPVPKCPGRGKATAVELATTTDSGGKKNEQTSKA